MMITSKYMAAGVFIDFLSFDQVTYLLPPSFKHDLEIIKTKIYNKIHDDGFINVCFWFSVDLARDLVFDPK